jgi:hypothetical protein
VLPPAPEVVAIEDELDDALTDDDPVDEAVDDEVEGPQSCVPPHCDAHVALEQTQSKYCSSRVRVVPGCPRHVSIIPPSFDAAVKQYARSALQLTSASHASRSVLQSVVSSVALHEEHAST